MSRVLLIEREGLSGRPLAAQLRARGHQVIEVVGRQELGQELAALHTVDPDAGAPDWIITDAEQSGGPGLDLVLDAHGLGGGTPVILIADAADVELAREADALDAAYVFLSPPEVDVLCRVTGPRDEEFYA